ncbi:MAG TPA: hypothetical protein VGD64_17020 [Acidisarcina sp.]
MTARCASFPANTYLKQAEVMLAEREMACVADLFDRAEALGADADQCAAGRWKASMLSGDFEAAWRESDAIRRRGAPDPNRFWRGEDIDEKRVIVRCLHGLGDAVQFLRYAPMLRERAAKLIVEVPPALRELAPYIDGLCAGGGQGGTEVITWGAQAPAEAPEWDVQIEVVELPYFFRTQAHHLPITQDYLRLPRTVLEEVAPNVNTTGNLKAGLVWASGGWNPSRSVPVDLLRPVVAIEGCEFWNLQGESARGQWSRLAGHGCLHDADQCSDTVLKLAALIAQMDLVITPDTLAVHLAGALGVPAWVMLESAADWRWMHQRNDSPWYPSLRLFRQQTPGDWMSVVRQISTELGSFAGNRRRISPSHK